MKKKILFINPCADIGGAEMSLLVLLSRLDRTLYQPTLLLPEEGMVADRAREMGVTVYTIAMHAMMIERNWKKSLREAWTALSDIHPLRQLIRELNVDLVHVNSYRVGLPALIAAKPLHIPVIWHIRDIPASPWKRQLVALLSRLPEHVIAISQAVATQIGIHNRANTSVIYNGIDVTTFQQTPPLNFKRETGLPDDAILLGTIGHLIPLKGHDLLIRAFAQLTQQQQIYLVIVGGHVSPVWSGQQDVEAYVAKLKELVQELGVQERVIFTGFRNDVPQIVADMTIYVHAAIEQEAFGRVIVEAMAASKPIIAPGWGGIPEIVIEKETGLLYKPGDLTGLVNCLEVLLADKGRREKMGQAGLAVTQAQFTAEIHAVRISNLFSKLLLSS